jgi:uncharacterized SAM-binding protein YcdF (DUF218 family)
MKKWVISFSFLFALIIGYVVIVYSIVARFGTRTRPKKSDVILVLGARVIGEEPSTALQERLDWAYHVYKKGCAPNIIVSGGKGDDESISEAEAMKRYLVEKGVSPHCIIVEDQSRSTSENMKFTAAIMKDKAMKSAIIVTQRFHQKRAQYLAKNEGLITSGYAKKSKVLSEPYWRLRETAGLANEVAKEVRNF